jgi:hypothetical protein
VCVDFYSGTIPAIGCRFHVHTFTHRIESTRWAQIKNTSNAQKPKKDLNSFAVLYYCLWFLYIEGFPQEMSEICFDQCQENTPK